ncbi:MCE family protein [Nocardioides deserti]|uniref:MCE family protein n=1 Tax=Nocardioides deserti TaxID=1588644 RepID=A0ABR6U566_9ACTN|nr:MCE family protein [Nocardioides deserti]MBC2958976.1 MCE family protein [Nocardioides deserti]GGO69089.1 ABC transporter substrate-binding protein [Nocardioides deserti]
MPRITMKAAGGLVAALLLLGTVLVLVDGDSGRKTVTAHFARAVSVFVGTEVRILGVPVGEVTAVVPEGESVRVEMEYDDAYDVPKDARAVIVTPTLVADRFIQLTPVHTSGPVMADGADIPLAETASPVELDRIYESLSTLANALGPNGANRNGSLDTLLASGAEALGGQGRTANQLVRDLSAAATTFGDNSGDLFGTVKQLDAFTRTLARNDDLVDEFMGDLGRATEQLSGEREELGAALEALAGAVGTVEAFVKDNRKALVGEVEDLTDVLDVLVAEKESLTQAIEKGPLGLGNLALGFDTKTGSQNARIQVGPNVEDLDGFLCAVVNNAGVPAAKTVCKLLESLLEPLGLALPTGPARSAAPDTRVPGEAVPAMDLRELLGGGPR